MLEERQILARKAHQLQKNRGRVPVREVEMEIALPSFRDWLYKVETTAAHSLSHLFDRPR
jgi:hypothetical protein